LKKRLSVIITAYVVASVAAGSLIGFVGAVGWAIELSVKQPTSAENGLRDLVLMIFGPMYGASFGALMIGIGMLLPAIGVISYAERKGIRSLRFYVLAACIAALVVNGLYFLIIFWNIGPKTDPSLWKYLLLVHLMTLIGGAVGGYIYWYIAGRGAEPLPPSSPHLK
jgi:hypothetical protein